MTLDFGENANTKGYQGRNNIQDPRGLKTQGAHRPTRSPGRVNVIEQA